MVQGVSPCEGARKHWKVRGETRRGSDKHMVTPPVSIPKESARRLREEMEPWHCSGVEVLRRKDVMHWVCISLGGKGLTLNSFGPSAQKTL